MCMFAEEIEQSLLEEYTTSDDNSSSDETDSCGSDDLTVGEVNLRNVAKMKVTMYSLLQDAVRVVIRKVYLRGRTWEIM